jgi:hypothetical protein
MFREVIDITNYYQNNAIRKLPDNTRIINLTSSEQSNSV